jgi:hypothetical protein
MQKSPIPDEIINHIMSFRIPDPVFLLFKDSFLYYLCDPSMNTLNKEMYLKLHGYNASFHEWYFCIAKKKKKIHIPLLRKQ